MFLDHYNNFNEAINNYKGDRDSLLWHENNLYGLAKEYLDGIDTLESNEFDWILRHMRWHVECICATIDLDTSADCVMYELLDALSLQRKELEAC